MTNATEDNRLTDFEWYKHPEHCCSRSPSWTSDFQISICFHSKTRFQTLVFTFTCTVIQQINFPSALFFPSFSVPLSLLEFAQTYSLAKFLSLFFFFSPSVYSSLHFFLLSHHLSMCQPCSSSSPQWHSELLLLSYTLTISSRFPTCSLSRNTFLPLISEAQMLVRFPWWQQQL